MWTIKYLNKNTGKVMVEQLVAKKESTAKQWAKQFVLHHNEFEILAILPC
jgi:hypothetical protein